MQQPSEATREAQKGFCISFQNEATLQIFLFGTSDSRASKQRISVVFKLSVLWQCVTAALGKAFRDLAGQSIQSPLPSVLPLFTTDLPVQACNSPTPTWFCDSVFTPAAPLPGKLLRLSSWWNCNSSFKTQIRGQTPRKIPPPYLSN